MEIQMREDFDPLNAAFTTNAHQLPTVVKAAIVRLCPDHAVDHSYLDARYTDGGGVAFDFYWIRGGVFGHVSAASEHAVWENMPVNEPIEHKINGRLRRLAAITRIELGTQTVGKKEWDDATLIVAGPILVHFDGVDVPVALGGDNPRNADDRVRRDAFVDAVLARFYA